MAWPFFVLLALCRGGLEMLLVLLPLLVGHVDDG
jgi:hypothetical protein